MYIRIKNSNPVAYTISQLLQDNPNTSFPENITPETLVGFDVFPVTELPRPNYDPDIHYLKPSNYYQVEGRWQMHYIQELLPEIQVAQTMREKRNSLLTQSDWVVSLAYEKQELVPESWQLYRQQLRDVTAQQGFPYEISWPTLIQV